MVKPAFEASFRLTPVKDGSISLFNMVASYSVEGIDLIYVESPLPKASGGALHIPYDLKPFKISGKVEYTKDNSLVGLKDGNKSWTFTLTPSYGTGSRSPLLTLFLL